MARIRTIKPSFFTSLTMADRTLEERLTFIGLWCYVDDSGVGLDDPRLIKAELWPLDQITVEEVAVLVDGLAASKLIHRYTAAGRHYLWIPGWGEHQRINRPTPSKFPQPPQRIGSPHGELTEPSLNEHGALTEASPPEGKGKEGKGTPLPPASGGSRPRRREATPDPPRGDLARMAANANRTDNEPPATDPFGAIREARAKLRPVRNEDTA